MYEHKKIRVSLEFYYNLKNPLVIQLYVKT